MQQKFEQLELIAKGGMAEVYRARTVGAQGFAKEVCVKKILPHLTADPQFVSMFVNEAKLAATLSSPNIVQVHDLCVSDEHEYFIVMEYVDGRDASDMIRAAQLAGREIPPPIAVFIVREVLKGLYDAHTKADPDGAPLNIIHRDISPQNVLVAFSGAVKLTDFGIAKASSTMNKTAVGILKGKYGYMSPEQARGEPLDPRSDLFCAGIVLYELLVGERCFAGASDYSTLNLMREAQVTPPSRINRALAPELEAIVLKALAKSPAQRYGDALEFEAALGAYARRSGAEAGAPELGRLVRALFKPGAESRPAGPAAGTGVLALSSIAQSPGPTTAPIPVPSPPGAPSPPPAESARPARKADADPARKADADPARKADADPARKADADSARKADAEPAAAPRKAARKKEPPAPDPEPANSAPPPEPAAAAEPKAARKPARLKADAAKDARRPIGRRDLRPGLSTLARIDDGGGLGRRALILAVATVGAGAIGWGLGLARESSAGHVSVFRALERERVAAQAPASGAPTVTVVLRSNPPGASLRFDGRPLKGKSPLAVELARDDREHVVELESDGGETRTERFRFGPEPYRFVDASFVAGGAIEPPGPSKPAPTDPRSPRARIFTDPPARVLVDGQDRGERADGRDIVLAAGKRQKLTLIDDANGARRELSVRQEEGETRTYVLGAP